VLQQIGAGFVGEVIACHERHIPWGKRADEKSRDMI